MNFDKESKTEKKKIFFRGQGEGGGAAGGDWCQQQAEGGPTKKIISKYSLYILYI